MADQKKYDFIPAKAESVIHIFLPAVWLTKKRLTPSPTARWNIVAKWALQNNTGELISEVLPKLAGVADKFTLIRSMTHGEAAHERGTHNMFTGYKPSPALIYPSFGSVISHEYGPRNNLPPYVCIPNRANEFAGSGYLSSSYGPFSLGSDQQQWLQGTRPRPAGGVDAERFAVGATRWSRSINTLLVATTLTRSARWIPSTNVPTA